jgi:O-antigen biosynthesis protein
LQGDAPIDRTHHHDLELLAAQALARNDYVRAFELSDRRCRIAPAPQPSSYLLRAESSFRMKNEAYAIADLDRVLDLAPDDAQANRRMLAWSKGKRKTRSARSLLANARDVEILRKAIGVLRQQGSKNLASVTVLDDRVEGWIVWDGSTAAEVEITAPDNTVSFFIDGDPFHILRNEGHNAASFSVTRPRSAVPQSFAVLVDGERLVSCRGPGNMPLPAVCARPDEFPGQAIPTIIIPIYADLAATKACLNSVLRAMPSDEYDVLLVSDAPPDRRITDYLDAFVERTGIRMLVNSRNMGFVGSINRALESIPSGDVILLNADTIVPSGFVGRLATAAHSLPDIGTVVPLTNNGEFSSFPIANEVNERGTLDEIANLDGIAAQVNRSVTVDIPSGIGFCLYITRACLNAVGHLSEHYQRGYLEDVDFCLRAREVGFRSVCAPSVYVGHEGSRSFKSEKRSLVVRNLQVLDDRFPRYREECSAFVALDPLRPAREAIERSMQPRDQNTRVIIAGGGVRTLAQVRGLMAHAEGDQALLLEISQGRSGMVVRPTGPDGAAPQNIAFKISDASEQDAFDRFLDAIRPSRFEIIDPARTPLPLIDHLIRKQWPYDLVIGDAGLFYPPERFPCAFAGSNGVRSDRSDGEASRQIEHWQHHWRNIVNGAATVMAPCPMAKAFACCHLPEIALKIVVVTEATPWSKPRPFGERLGLITLRNSADEFQMIHDVSQAILGRHPSMKLVIIGSTMDDRRLMQHSNIHITGAVEPDEFGRVVEQYDLGAVLLADTMPLFGHPLAQAAMASGLSLARFDWSDGTYRGRDPDLLIDIHSTSAAIADAVLGWMGH